MKITFPEGFLRSYEEQSDKSNPYKLRKESKNYRLNPIDRNSQRIGYIIECNDEYEEIIIDDLLSLKLDGKLKDMADAVRQSTFILDLQEGWGENGKAINNNVYVAAISLLTSYASKILFEGFLLPAPEINPVRDGSIDLVWRTDAGYFAINVAEKNGKLLGTFYGHGKGKPGKEGHLDCDTVEKSMALLMIETLL